MIEILLVTFLVRTAIVTRRNWRRSLFMTPETAILWCASIIFVVPLLILDPDAISDVTLFGLAVVVLLTSVDSRRLAAAIPRFTGRIRLSRAAARRLIALGAIAYLCSQLVPALEVLMQRGLTAALLRDRLGEYFETGISAASIIFPIELATVWIYYLYVGTKASGKSKKILWLFTAAQVVALTITANTRLSILIPMAAAFAFIAYQHHYSAKRIAVLVFGAAMFFPVFIVTTNAIRQGIEPALDSAQNAVGFVSQQLDYNKYVVLTEQHVRSAGVEYGYGWFLGLAGNLVPRALWADKPVTSASNRFTEIITKEKLSAYNPVITFTLFGDGYLQFGLLGVALGLSVFYLVMTCIFWRFMRMEGLNGKLAGFHFLLLCFVYFRAEIPFVQMIIAGLTVALYSDRRRVAPRALVGSANSTVAQARKGAGSLPPFANNEQQ